MVFTTPRSVAAVVRAIRYTPSTAVESPQCNGASISGWGNEIELSKRLIGFSYRPWLEWSTHFLRIAQAVSVTNPKPLPNLLAGRVLKYQAGEKPLECGLGADTFNCRSNGICVGIQCLQCNHGVLKGVL